MTIDRTMLTLAAATALGATAFAGAQAQGVDKQNPQRIYNEQAVGGGAGGASAQGGSVGAQITLSPADVRLMEQRLNAAGYSVGNVDGVWDAQTQQALQNFQEAQGYAPSGTLNLATISALGLFEGSDQVSNDVGAQQAQAPGVNPRANSSVDFGASGADTGATSGAKTGANAGSANGVGTSGDIPANNQRILNEPVD